MSHSWVGKNLSSHIFTDPKLLFLPEAFPAQKSQTTHLGGRNTELATGHKWTNLFGFHPVVPGWKHNFQEMDWNLSKSKHPKRQKSIFEVINRVITHGHQIYIYTVECTVYKYVLPMCYLIFLQISQFRSLNCKFPHFKEVFQLGACQIPRRYPEISCNFFEFFKGPFGDRLFVLPNFFMILRW